MHPFEPIFNGLAASYTEQKSVSVPWYVWPGTEESLDCVIPTCFFFITVLYPLYEVNRGMSNIEVLIVFFLVLDML
jgi:hypothetical protein